LGGTQSASRGKRAHDAFGSTLQLSRAACSYFLGQALI